MTEQENRSLAFFDPFADFDFPRWALRGRPRPGDPVWPATRGGFAPAVDVTESDERYLVSAELPGIAKDDVTVEVHDGVLTIRGEKRSEKEESDEHHRHVERVFGSFSRAFSLPPNADGDRIKARFQDGVLEIEIPKMAEAKPKTVDIKG